MPLERTVAGLHCLARGLTWNREQILAFQSKRLRELVRHAYERVPFYRRRFDEAGLRPEQIRGLEDLGRIPLTLRADLQDATAEDLLARGVDSRRLCNHLTSGSSGAPLNIRRTWFEERLLQAWRLRVMGALGFRVTDRRAAVVTARGVGHPLYTRLGLLRYEELHCLWPPERILERLREIRPDVLRGYPSTLSWLAGLLTEADRDLIRPRFVTTDSEMMTPDMRSRIVEGFGAPVIDFYDSHEFNLIAAECPGHGAYHVSDASVIVEVLKNGREAGPDEEGEVVGTALHSWAMPFLRLRLGDVVARAPGGCPCGAPNSALARVEGRLMERFVLPDGSSVHPYTLVSPLLRQAPWLRRFQIVQEQPGLIRVRMVALGNTIPSVETVAEAERMLEKNLGEGIRVRAELVDEIPAEPNGKFRPYYSLVSETGQALNDGTARMTVR